VHAGRRWRGATAEARAHGAQVRELEVAHMSLDEPAARALASITRLRSLHLRRVAFATPAGFALLTALQARRRAPPPAHAAPPVVRAGPCAVRGDGRAGGLERLQASHLVSEWTEDRGEPAWRRGAQALRALELDNVAGAAGGSVDAALGALTGLTWLALRKSAAAVQLPPLLCLPALPALQARPAPRASARHAPAPRARARRCATHRRGRARRCWSWPTRTTAPRCRASRACPRCASCATSACTRRAPRPAPAGSPARPPERLGTAAAPPRGADVPARLSRQGQGRGDARDAHPVQVGVTDAVVRAAGRCDKLAALHIPDSFRVTDEGLAGLARATALVRPAGGALPPRLRAAPTGRGAARIPRSVWGVKKMGCECRRRSARRGRPAGAEARRRARRST